MDSWTKDFEAELTQLLKEWLKHQGKTQADLRRSLRAVSTRMPALLEALQKEHQLHGLSGLASILCEIEAEWHCETSSKNEETEITDPFGQLDMLLQEIRKDNPE
tara:strand:- start:20 stop:334 length:315 start_codon:yes stop_codon:yes gene_type:complete